MVELPSTTLDTTRAAAFSTCFSLLVVDIGDLANMVLQHSHWSTQDVTKACTSVHRLSVK